jgi:hypothetical protein
MDMLEWLNPSIEKRISEISDDILANSKPDGYKSFMDILRGQEALSPEIIMELGDLFISHTQHTVEESYITGVKEILSIKS